MNLSDRNPASRIPPSSRAAPPLPSRSPLRSPLKHLKLGFIGLIGAYGVLCAFNPATFRWLDLVNLVFHEAGHLVFGFFGEFFGILGGSLMQVLIPGVVTGYFLLYGQRWSGMVTLFWVSESLFSVSVYVKDARAQALPLLGGDDAIHDWHWLLSRLGILPWDQVVGAAIYAMGLVALAASILGGVYVALNEQVSDA